MTNFKPRGRRWKPCDRIFKFCEFWRKENKIEPFEFISENSSPKGFFGQIRKNSLLLLCRLTLDIFRFEVLRSSTHCFLSQAAVYLVSAIPSNISKNIRKTSKNVKSSTRAYGDLGKSWEIFVKKIIEVSTKILICTGVQNLYWYDTKITLIFSQVESNNLYC